MTKKNVLIAVVSIVLVFSLTLPAFAASSVSTWCSNDNQVSYTKYDGSYYIYNLSTNSNFSTNFYSVISAANSQWSAALPISISETSFNYALQYIYGGTRSQLINSFPALPTDATGLTVLVAQGGGEPVATVSYNGSTKYVFSLSAGNKMCVVEMPGRTATGYKNTAVHEMGHLFGWMGHSPQTSDVMYANPTENFTLTSRDKTHLSQIYSLFR